MDDLYAVLGVSRDADQVEIRAAYRQLAQTFHPDHTPGSEARMVAINHAYAVLGDPERRRHYDALLPVSDDRLPRDDRLAPGDERPWALDLDEHADDWRNMYAEERLLWEQLLASQPQPGPGRQAIEAALDRARRAQLDLENALRAREGLPPLSMAAFDAQRETTPATSTGCLLTPLVVILSPFAEFILSECEGLRVISAKNPLALRLVARGSSLAARCSSLYQALPSAVRRP